MFNPVSARIAISRFWNSHGVSFIGNKNPFALLVCSDFFFYKIVRFFFHCRIFNFYKIFFSHLLVIRSVKNIKILLFLYDAYFQSSFKNSQNYFFPSRCRRFSFPTVLPARTKVLKKFILYRFRRKKHKLGFKQKENKLGFKQKENKLGFKQKENKLGFKQKENKLGFKRKKKRFGFKSRRKHFFSSIKYYKFLRSSFSTVSLSNLYFLLWNPRETFKSIFFFGLRNREFFPFQTLRPLTDAMGNLDAGAALEHPEFPFKIVRAMPSSHMVPSTLQLVYVFLSLFQKLFKRYLNVDVFILNIGRQTLTAKLLCEHMLRKILFKGKPKTRHSTITKGFFRGYLGYLRRVENLLGCSVIAKGRIVRQQRSMYKWIAHYGFFSRNRSFIPTTYCKGSIATKNGVLTLLVYFTKFFVPKALFLRSFIGHSDFYFTRTNFQRVFFNETLASLNQIMSRDFSQSVIFRERAVYFGREPIVFSNIFSGVLKKRLFFPLTSVRRVKRKFSNYQEYLSVDFNLRRRLKKLYRLRVKESNFRIL